MWFAAMVGPLSKKNLKNFEKMLLTPVMWGLGWRAILLPDLYSYSISGNI